MFTICLLLLDCKILHIYVICTFVIYFYINRFICFSQYFIHRAPSDRSVYSHRARTYTYSPQCLCVVDMQHWCFTTSLSVCSLNVRQNTNRSLMLVFFRSFIRFLHFDSKQFALELIKCMVWPATLSEWDRQTKNTRETICALFRCSHTMHNWTPA